MADGELSRGLSTDAVQVVDVGCGIGGSSRHLARRFGARTTGITLSPVQASRGATLAEQQGLGSQCSFQVLVMSASGHMHCHARHGLHGSSNAVLQLRLLWPAVRASGLGEPARSSLGLRHAMAAHFMLICDGSSPPSQVADALQQPFEEGSFDLVWSMESGEHMPDKQRFVGELARVAAPGGRIIIVTWCHRWDTFHISQIQPIVVESHRMHGAGQDPGQRTMAPPPAKSAVGCRIRSLPAGSLWGLGLACIKHCDGCWLQSSMPPEVAGECTGSACGSPCSFCVRAETCSLERLR